MTKNASLLQFLIGFAAIIVILAGIKMSGEIVVPFLMSLFIAIICSPLIKFMTQRKVPHWLAITILFLLIVLIFFFLFGLINSSIREFTQSMPQYRLLLSERLNDVMALAQKWNIPLTIQRDELLEKFDPSSIMNFASRVLLNLSNVVSNAFVLILVVIFMLLEAPTAKRKVALALSNNSLDRTQEELHIDRILQGVIRYLGVKTVISLLTGFCVWVLLEVAGVQYAVLWATLSFLFNYIPNIGSVIAAIPIILQALLLNGFSVGFGVTVGVIAINMVIGNILELSKVDSGAIVPQIAENDLREILYDAAGVILPAAKQQGIELLLDLPDPIMCLCDESMIFSVVSNLLTNSLRYAQSCISIEAGRGTNGQEVWIQVLNDGPSISKADAAHIFDRFYKGEKGQSGIGMSLANEYVAVHHGQISVSPVEGGTLSRVVLPVPKKEKTCNKCLGG